MSEINNMFTRKLQSKAREKLKTFLGDRYSEFIKHFWTYRYDDGLSEVHINKCSLFPEGFFKTMGRTDNKWHANGDGIILVLEELKKRDCVYICCDCETWTEEKPEKCGLCGCECFEEIRGEDVWMKINNSKRRKRK